MLRHMFVTTMLDAGVVLRDFPESPLAMLTGHHDGLRLGARANLDRHPNYILAAYMASGT